MRPTALARGAVDLGEFSPLSAGTILSIEPHALRGWLRHIAQVTSWPAPSLPPLLRGVVVAIIYFVFAKSSLSLGPQPISPQKETRKRQPTRRPHGARAGMKRCHRARRARLCRDWAAAVGCAAAQSTGVRDLGTLSDGGPFARPDLNDSFLLTIAFVISTAVPSLVLSTDVATRRLSEKRHRALVEYANDIVAILDLDLRFTSVNPAIERILGFAPAEVIGRSLRRHVSQHGFS